jgi:hypothetical protein
MASTAEEATLFAVMSEDYAEARRLLADSYPGELTTFLGYVEELEDLIQQAIEDKKTGGES